MTSQIVGQRVYRFVLKAFILTATLALGAGGALAEEPSAVLAVVVGDVTIQRGDDKLPGSFGASLEAGDVVVTGTGGQASILFESGQILELDEGSKMSIGALPSKKTGPILAQVNDAFSGSLTRFASNPSGEAGLSALPDLRSGAKDEMPTPVSPRNTLVLPQGVVLEWAPVEEVLEYRVILTGPGKLAGSHASTEPRLVVPEPGFEPGQRWSWSVEAMTPDGPIQSEEVVIEVATAKQIQELANLHEQLDPLAVSENGTRVDTATYLLGSYCRSAGFYSSAIGHLETLVARNNGRKELYQELGSLYQTVGRNDKAAEAYRLALAK